VKVPYSEVKRTAPKKRDIWARVFLCDPISTPASWLLANLGVSPIQVTVVTFLLGIGAAVSFFLGNLLAGAILYALCFLSDSMDGKLTRVLKKDDTYRGIIDFILDGVVCVAVVMGLAMNGDRLLLLLLLLWMGLHYIDMRHTSATYRLKVQFGDTNVWLINPEAEAIYNKSSAGFTKWAISTYHFIMYKMAKLRTYPHPTVGEAVILIFVVGPLLWWSTGDIFWMYLVTGLGFLGTLPEVIGAGMIAYILASKKKGE